MGNNASAAVLGIGTCKLDLRGGHTLYLHDVLYAPEVRRNLVSVLALLQLGFNIAFVGCCVKIHLDNIFYGSGFVLNGFMVLDIVNVSIDNDASIYVVQNSSTINDSNIITWHARLGHIGQDRLHRLARAGLLGSLTKEELPICEHCLARKATRLPFGKAKRASSPLQLIHSNICGPMNVRARNGGNYFITFIDDFTRFGHVYLISHKSEALDCFIRYTNLVENKLSTKIKALRTDRGREYLSEQFKNFCDEKGIARQLTISYTPQQNSVAERRNRTLFDMVRSMRAQTNLPISFWGDALLTAAYILNRVPSKSVSSTPYELWSGVKPNLGYFHPWGCATYIHNTSHEYGKLGPRGKKCIFI
jgi:transposase InsO family protein